MARKPKHEEHQNHEAWAIPYGDLVTLLFALFTVMYAVSSVNQGKFRVLSDSMIAAFDGPPKNIRPINIGDQDAGKGGDKPVIGVTPTEPVDLKDPDKGAGDPTEHAALTEMQHAVQDSMQVFIDANQVKVRRENNWLEIEINSDVLFASGAGEFSPEAEPVLDKLAQVLKPFPNPIRVEGHTDDRPIKTAAFPSNWELSAARAASVVHQFTQMGVEPLRLEIVGYGEFRPRQPNDTVEGRNANRRVVVLVRDEAAPDSSQTPPPGPLPAPTTSSGASPTTPVPPAATNQQSPPAPPAAKPRSEPAPAQNNVNGTQ
jgi:chemotaxis protein MotB